MPDRRFGGVFLSGAGLAAAGFIEEARTRSPVKSYDASATARIKKFARTIAERILALPA
jgi:hypothetical protein